MSYVICKHNNVRIDLMVRKKYQAQVVSMLERMHCRYESEEECNPNPGDTWVCLKDLSGENGAYLGEALGLFYAMEWDNLIEGVNEKYYILINPRRKEKKKDVHENRTEADPGSEGGNSGEPA